MNQAEINALWRRSFRLDLLRSVPQGVIDTIGLTFAVFLAVRLFDASPVMKTVLVSAASYGLLASLLVVPFVRRSGFSVNLWSALFWGLAAGGLFLAALWPTSTGFLVGVFIFLFSSMLGLPLTSQLYRSLYPDHTRGRLFSIAAVVRALAATAAAILVGALLEEDAWNYRAFFVACGGLTLGIAGCVLALKQVTLPPVERLRLFAAFSHVKQDAAFRKLLISWMILGTGNLTAVALFVEYAANPVHGIAYGAEKISLLTTVVPSILFLLTVVGWGFLFDRLNFYLMRALLNLCFAAGIGMYFLVGEEWALWAGIGLHGLARGGANVIWSLWVTKFAASESVADYMSVHTFLTGVRGVLAPVLGFALIENASPQVVGAVSVGLILLATAIISPDIRFRRAQRPGYQDSARPMP